MEKAIKDLRDLAARADNEKFFRRAASMQKALDKMVRIEKPKFDKAKVKLNFSETERSGNQVISVKGLYKGYEGKILFEDGTFEIKYKDRAALIGANGCGKTTFLKMLLGEEAVDGGNIIMGSSVKYAYLPQMIGFENEELTILDEFRSDISMVEGKAREYLSKFMFFGSDVFKKIKHLSGGERIRLKLAELLYRDINLIILDEPTNHLDINSIDTLEEALDKFKGTVFFISHDRYFLNKMSNKIIEVENHRFNTYEGNYDDYKKEKMKKEVNKNTYDGLKEKINKIQSTQSLNECTQMKDEFKKEETLNWLQKKEEQREKRKRENKIKKLEEKIFELEEKISEIEKAMLEAGSNYEEANKLCLNKSELEKELQGFMEEWEKCFN